MDGRLVSAGGRMVICGFSAGAAATGTTAGAGVLATWSLDDTTAGAGSATTGTTPPVSGARAEPATATEATDTGWFSADTGSVDSDEAAGVDGANGF